jgi:hypothetical protein
MVLLLEASGVLYLKTQVFSVEQRWVLALLVLDMELVGQEQD